MSMTRPTIPEGTYDPSDRLSSRRRPSSLTKTETPPMRTAPALTLLAAAALLGTSGCYGDAAQDTVQDAPEEVVLGPADGHELPGADLERVQVGDPAPDFSLASLSGPTVTLSDLRGVKNVVLVFYRGHW